MCDLCSILHCQAVTVTGFGCARASQRALHTCSLPARAGSDKLPCLSGSECSYVAVTAKTQPDCEQYCAAISSKAPPYTHTSHTKTPLRLISLHPQQQLTYAVALRNCLRPGSHGCIQSATCSPLVRVTPPLFDRLPCQGPQLQTSVFC